MSPLTCLSCNPPKVGVLSCDCITPRIANVKGAREPLAKDLARCGITQTSTRPFFLQKVNALSLQSAPLTGTMTGTMTGCHCSVASAHGKAPGGTSVQIVRAARQESLLPLASLVGGARQIKTYPLFPFPFSLVNSEFSQSSIRSPTQTPPHHPNALHHGQGPHVACTGEKNIWLVKRTIERKKRYRTFLLRSS